MNLLDHIRQVPDFPKPGINFFDISTLIAHPEARKHALDSLEALITPHAPDVIAGLDARGFLFGMPLADRLGVPMVMVRKKGKLPGATRGVSYGLEYGAAAVEIQNDAVQPGTRVVLIDDLLATGGTLAAAETLFTDAGAQVVGMACVIELAFLGGRQKLAAPFSAIVSVDGE